MSFVALHWPVHYSIHYWSKRIYFGTSVLLQAANEGDKYAHELY